MATQKISIVPILNKVPSDETLENRFVFVDDVLLKANLAITLKHIVLLSLLITELDLPGSILFSFIKTSLFILPVLLRLA
jgi:hypothetical protein